MANNLTTEIKKLRLNAILGKKKHYNASDRKRKAHHCLSYSVLMLNIITGSILFGVFKDNLWEHTPAVFALMSAILIGTEEYFKFGKHSVEHQAVGGRYLGLVRECSSLIALQCDGHLTDADLKLRFSELQKSLTEIDISANSYPTTREDYEESRKGLNDGEEQYTHDELNKIG